MRFLIPTSVFKLLTNFEIKRFKSSFWFLNVLIDSNIINKKIVNFFDRNAVFFKLLMNFEELPSDGNRKFLFLFLFIWFEGFQKSFNSKYKRKK